MSRLRPLFDQSHVTVVYQQTKLQQSRRSFLKSIVLGATGIVVAPALSGMSAYAAEAEGNKVLILYFSHSGNTRQLA